MCAYNFRRMYVRSIVAFLTIMLTVVCIIEPLKKVYSTGIKKNDIFDSIADIYFKTGIQPEEVFLELPVGRARRDNKHILRIHDFHFTGSQWESLALKYDICFATQTTIERIYWVPYILEKWTGPLSIAIQLISDEEWLIFNLYLNYLTKCHSTFKSQVALHLAVPANLTTLKIDNQLLSQYKDINWETISARSEQCPEAKEYLQYLLEILPIKDKLKLKYKEVYPQNQMRNIGRKGCATHWTYSADVDIIPNDGMADMLQKFYNNQKMQGKLCEKCAYVIPTFEVDDSVPFPENKKNITALFKSGAAQPFHIKVYSPGHTATDYKRWITTNLEDEAVTISHEVNQNKIDRYEPFYISSDEIVPFDERFLGYGYTRSSQFKTAISAGWKFSVLTPVFSIHWGLQSGKTVFAPKKDGIGKAVRLEQTEKNSRLYFKLVRELECKKDSGLI